MSYFLITVIMSAIKDNKMKIVRKRTRNGSLLQNSTNLTHNTSNTNLNEILSNPNDESTKLADISRNPCEKPALLDELEEEIERQLESKARKNNLSVSNVKNMIKAVITSQDVLTLMDFNLNMSEERPPYEPKLTRAKTRELLAKDSTPPIWPLGGSPRKSSDIVELINQELPDDSSDEEYCPQDDGTDDESKLEDSFLDEELLVADTIKEFNAEYLANDIAFDGSIGQRTRSKLCLSETPLEAIEQAFIPPDITTDMYATNCENPDWLDFLKEFTQPLDASAQNEVNDDDNDPEYNVMVDEEHEGTDREELRMDRAVKVSKKELNALISERYEYNAPSSDDEDNRNVKSNMAAANVINKQVDPEICCIKQEEDSDICCVYDSFNQTDPLQSEDAITAQQESSVFYDDNNVPYIVSEEVVIFDEQKLLLGQQIRQHIQLLLTSFLLSYGHPKLAVSYASSFKDMMMFWNNIDEATKNSVEEALKMINMKPSLDLVNRWESLMEDSTKKQNIERFILKEMDIVKRCKKNKVWHKPEIPVELIRICRESRAFVYPLMLPCCGFLSGIKKTALSASEINLIAFGLQEYFLQNGGEVQIMQDLSKVVDYVCENKTPVWSNSTVIRLIRRSIKSKNSNNAIKSFIENKTLPKINHYVISMPNKLLKLYEQPPVLLPEKWRIYLRNLSAKYRNM